MVLCVEVLINVICVISTYKETVDEIVAAPMHTAGQRELNRFVLYVQLMKSWIVIRSGNIY